MIDALNMEGLTAVNADQMREEFGLTALTSAEHRRIPPGMTMYVREDDPFAACRKRQQEHEALLTKIAPKRILGIPDYEPPTEPHLIGNARLSPIT